jgi:hypothetical protein
MNCLVNIFCKKTKDEKANVFFKSSTPEAFKERFLKQAKGNVVKAKILEEKFHYEIRQ